MIDRNIFTESKPSAWETIADYALAFALGLCLAMGALAYFDVLTK